MNIFPANPAKRYEFAEDSYKTGALRRADVGIGPYGTDMDCIRNFELLQSSWEKSRKTEGLLQIYNTSFSRQAYREKRPSPGDTEVRAFYFIEFNRF